MCDCVTIASRDNNTSNNRVSLNNDVRRERGSFMNKGNSERKGYFI